MQYSPKELTLVNKVEIADIPEFVKNVLFVELRGAPVINSFISVLNRIFRSNLL